MSQDNLAKVRRRLEQATELIEATDEKITKHKIATLDAMARSEKLEVDLQSSKRRIVLIHEDLRVTKERLSGQEEKLKTTQESCEEVEKARDEMESKEQEIEQTMENLETSIKEMKRKSELNAAKVVESERKQGVCTSEIARIRERAENNEARVKVLEGVIGDHGKSLSELEEREGAAGQRETLNEEKMTFLEGQLKDTTVRAETAERMYAVLKNTNTDTEAEIAKWVKRREDMVSQMMVMDDVADDPAYLCFEAAGGGLDSGRSTPAATFGAKAELFGKQKESSRPGSRASGPGSRPQTPADRPAKSPTPTPAQAPSPAPAPAPAPAPEPEPEKEEESEEEEESDDEWS